MAKYKRPGVYINQTGSPSASVAQVETAIPAFIGYTAAIPKSGAKVPVKITSLLEYEESFGKAKPYAYEVQVNRDKKTGALTVPSIGQDAEAEQFILYYALQLYFANGGGPCYIVPLGDTDNHEAGLQAVEKEDEVTLLVCPDVHPTGADYASVYQAALDQCGQLKDRFAILDVARSDTRAADFRSVIGIKNLAYGAAYLPYLETNLPYYYEEASVQVSINNGPAKSLASLKGKQEEVYLAVIRTLQNAPKVVLPPSAAMAGIYALVDNTRGVWKAPANVSVSGATGLTDTITNAEQENLNVDPVAGKSINAIRPFPGQGILVWGARTLAGNDNEWRYVPVRRFFNMIEESVQRSTTFAVFEPNDANTWATLKAMIDHYLTDLWRRGALAGATAKEAFFVKVGLGETMTQQDILEGKLIIEMGVAPTRPAEFIMVRIMHKVHQP